VLRTETALAPLSLNIEAAVTGFWGRAVMAASLLHAM
jgi:hypothetical protein